MDANSYEKFKGIIAEQLAFEEEYGMEIPDEDAEKIQTVGAAWDYVQEKLGITT